MFCVALIYPESMDQQRSLFSADWRVALRDKVSRQYRSWSRDARSITS